MASGRQARHIFEKWGDWHRPFWEEEGLRREIIEIIDNERR
jgi:hypothetical protein